MDLVISFILSLVVGGFARRMGGPSWAVYAVGMIVGLLNMIMLILIQYTKYVL